MATNDPEYWTGIFKISEVSFCQGERLLQALTFESIDLTCKKE